MNVSKGTPAPTADDLFISETSEVGSNWTKYLEGCKLHWCRCFFRPIFLRKSSNAPSVVGE